MKKRMTLMIIFLVIVFGGIFGWFGIRMYFMKQFFASYKPPAVTISSSKVETSNWTPFIKSVGVLKAVNGVEISPEVSGIVSDIYFKSGQSVVKGEPLLKMEDSVQQADLQDAKASLQLNQVNYDRLDSLLKKNATSQSEVDTAEAQLKQSKATVAKNKALIAQKNIQAPFSGQLGIREVNIGQYVSAGTGLVTLQAIAPIYVDFYLPEQDLPKIHVGQIIKLSVDTYPNDWFNGRVTAINSTVNIQTHNIQVRATMQNKSQKLFPGLFSNVHVMLPIKEKILTVPETAITYSLFGDSVYIIQQEGKDKDGKPILIVKQTYVKTGDQINEKVVILSGLKPNEQVVTSGQLKLETGTHVIINNTITLDGAPNELY